MNPEEATVPTKSSPAQTSQSPQLEKEVETVSSECQCDNQLIKTKDELAKEASPGPTEKLATLGEAGEDHALGSGLRLESKGLDQPPENQASAQFSSTTIQEGYDYALVDKSLYNEDDMRCLICHLIPRVPAKVDCCGLIFCHACITAHSNKQKNAACPHCNATDFKWITDKLLLRKINTLQVHCVNHNKGCEWTGDLHYAQEHLQKATNIGGNNVGRCDYEIVECETCGENFMYGKLEQHNKNVCKYRRIPCEYEFAGCEFECPEVDMPKHVEENTAKHLSLVTRHVRHNTEHVQVNTEQIQGNTGHIRDHNLQIQANTSKYRALFSYHPKVLLICLIFFVFLFCIQNQVQEIENKYRDQLQRIEKQLNNISLSLSTVTDDTIELRSNGRDMHSSIHNNKQLIQTIEADVESLKENMKKLNSGVTRRIDDILRWFVDTFGWFIPKKLL